MTLPTLNTNKYTTIIPSTGNKVEYRPFLVKEEKLLMIAQESDDQKDIINAIRDIIDSCTFNKLDVKSLKTYDIEHLFLQLRIKSVDEKATVNLKCPHCKSTTHVEIDLEAAKVEGLDDIPNNNILLNDEGIGITLKPLTLEESAGISESAKDFNKIIALCIESIYDSDNVYDRKNVNSAELYEFIDSFSRKNVMDVQNYITGQPTLRYSAKHICLQCGKEFDVKLSGIQDFFV